MRLDRDFFARDTLDVARDLLGRRLVRVLDSRRVSGRIVETEAYVGVEDQASHASPGLTRRNASMFGPPGHAYVYLIYGIHHCLNVVTEAEGSPAAVLIRALEPLEGLSIMRRRRGGRSDEELTAGPGRLCEALAIDLRFDGADLCSSEAFLFVEPGVVVPGPDVAAGPRVNVSGDTKAVGAPWRFHVRGNPFVSS